MGASGAGAFALHRFEWRISHVTGKTTCLDVLAQRKNIGVITGDVLVDGRPIGADFARGTAYGTPLASHFRCLLIFVRS